MSKYAYEILRFIIQQRTILPKNVAMNVCYGLFVNERGAVGSHICADMVMEHVVQAQKKQIKHLFSNKSEETIYRKSAALQGLNMIGKRFDITSPVVHRQKAHQTVSALEDEIKMISDLRKIKPFVYTNNRPAHSHFQNIPVSILHGPNDTDFRSWFHKKKRQFETEAGK